MHRARPAPAKTVFKLGIVGNATTDFILPALEVALLRRGILLEVVAADFDEPGDDDVVRKVLADLAGKGVTEAQIRAKMAELLAEAVKQIQSGT